MINTTDEELGISLSNISIMAVGIYNKVEGISKKNLVTQDQAALKDLSEEIRKMLKELQVVDRNLEVYKEQANDTILSLEDASNKLQEHKVILEKEKAKLIDSETILKQNNTALEVKVTELEKEVHRLEAHIEVLNKQIRGPEVKSGENSHDIK